MCDSGSTLPRKPQGRRVRESRRSQGRCGGRGRSCLRVRDSLSGSRTPRIGSPCAGADCITLAEFRQALRSGAYFKMLKRYSGVELHLYSLDAHGRLWPYALLLPPLSRGETVIRDSEGGCLRVGLSLTMRLLYEAARDRVAAVSLTSRLDRSLDRIAGSTAARDVRLLEADPVPAHRLLVRRGGGGIGSARCRGRQPLWVSSRALRCSSLRTPSPRSPKRGDTRDPPRQPLPQSRRTPDGCVQ